MAAVRVTLVHNPKAGDERHNADVLQALIGEAGHSLVAYRSIDSPDWPYALWETSDLVAVAGGDGTVRKVFKELVRNPKTVTLLPLGSANNIAESLGFADEDFATLVRDWASGRTRPFDVGEVRERSASVRFVESIGGGVFAEVLARADRLDVHPDGEAKIEFGLRLLRAALEDAPVLPWRLEADGADLSGAFIAVETMNTRQTGPNVPLAPSASPADGRLDLVRIRAEDRPALAAYAEARLAGREAVPLELAAAQVAEIRIRPPSGLPLRVDDERWARDEEASDDAIVVTAGDPLQVLVPAR
jgi:diacylglycerol kinase (ATP)